MAPSSKEPELTLDNYEQVLAKDTKIKVAGVDVDGILRGKIMSKQKFLSVVKDGFGFCSVIFGWGTPPIHLQSPDPYAQAY